MNNYDVLLRLENLMDYLLALTKKNYLFYYSNENYGLI